MDKPGFIPPHGNYQQLLSYRKAEVIFDITHRFCQRFLSKGDRTIDQMVQAARSGKQNIAEGSVASGTSKETEIKLTNVARASLEELLIDYRDFLRVRDLVLWAKDSKEAKFVRGLSQRANRTSTTNRTNETHTSDEAHRSHESHPPYSSHQPRTPHQPPESYALYRDFIETRPAETVANIAICLIHQANYLLDQQIRRLEEDFIKHGGLRERMTRVRLQHRDRRAT